MKRLFHPRRLILSVVAAALFAVVSFAPRTGACVRWRSQQQAAASIAAKQPSGQNAAAGQSAAPAIAQKRELRGVGNFGEVSATLFRGRQPSGEGMEELKKLGIEIVVNLRDQRDKIENERRQVESLGMSYVTIPWKASHMPDHRQVAQFLALLRANPDKKIFVHCHHGADRTGTMLAAHRIANQGWIPAQAYREMRAFNYHWFWHRHMKKYVFAFPAAYSTEAAFAALRTEKPQPARTGP